MKIALVGPAHPLRGGGISTFNERLAKALQDEGNEVVIYSFSLQYPGLLFPGKSQFTDEPAPKGLEIKSVINSINPFNWIKVGLQLKNQKFDLVIVRFWIPFMGPCLGTILRFVRQNKYSKIVCIADNVIPHEKRFGDLIFTKYFLKPVDAFVTMSAAVMNDLKGFTQKKILCTPHPLYDNYGQAVDRLAACKKLNLDPNFKYLLFFGFIRKYKGLDLLLEALKDNRFKESSFKLIVAGEFYEDKELCESLIQELNGQVITFTDFIPNDEVKLYFSVADLVVQPYRTATNSGITQIAYHFEKPMLVTNVGGLKEVVIDHKTGIIVEPNPSSIANGIFDFFQPDSIPNIQENLITEKRKYSWTLFVDKLINIIK